MLQEAGFSAGTGDVIFSKGGTFMLGFSDFGIALVYLLCIASTVLCVVYGFINWNRGNGKEPVDLEAARRWNEKEQSIEENL